MSNPYISTKVPGLHINNHKDDYFIPNCPTIIHFAEKHCDENWHFNTCELDFYSFTFVLEGSVDYTVDGHNFIASKGDIIFIRPGSKRFASTTGFDCVAIDFILDRPFDYPSLETHMHHGNLSEFRMYFNQIKREYLQKEPGYQLKCSANFMLVLHKLFYDAKETEKNTHVEKIKDYIIQNYMHPLNVSSIAEQVGISPVYCGALFKRYENKSIGQYVNQVRIHASLELLFLNIPIPIAQIAESVGFSDIYYFSNTFKKIVGVSPLNYRKKNI